MLVLLKLSCFFFVFFLKLSCSKLAVLIAMPKTTTKRIIFENERRKRRAIKNGTLQKVSNNQNQAVMEKMRNRTYTENSQIVEGNSYISIIVLKANGLGTSLV